MNGTMLARLGAVVFVAVAIAATAIGTDRKEEASAGVVPGGTQAAGGNPLRAELSRCGRLGEVGARDAECLRVWAENRRRFLGAFPSSGTER